MTLPVPLIDANRCTGCGLCIRVCPTSAMTIKHGLAVVTNPQACTYSGYCERICPVDAISRPFQIMLFIHEEENSMQSMFYPDWQEKVVFSPEGPQPQILTENEKLKVIIAGLEVGQKIPLHPDALAVYHFLEGTGWMIVDDKRYAVSPGATVITPEGAVRGAEAETRLVLIAARIA
ncbi:MAG: 4Fe-4S binding protein [Anaerolineae bacterium]|nr:4Fe-4S binding protein [Anaerolineae bacterium]